MLSSCCYLSAGVGLLAVIGIRVSRYVSFGSIPLRYNLFRLVNTYVLSAYSPWRVESGLFSSGTSLTPEKG